MMNLLLQEVDGLSIDDTRANGLPLRSQHFTFCIYHFDTVILLGIVTRSDHKTHSTTVQRHTAQSSYDAHAEAHIPEYVCTRTKSSSAICEMEVRLGVLVESCLESLLV